MSSCESSTNKSDFFKELNLAFVKKRGACASRTRNRHMGREEARWQPAGSAADVLGVQQAALSEAAEPAGQPLSDRSDVASAKAKPWRAIRLRE